MRGSIMVGRQKIRVGLAHAAKPLRVIVEADTCQVTVGPGLTMTAPRTTSRGTRRHKASIYLTSCPAAEVGTLALMVPVLGA